MTNPGFDQSEVMPPCFTCGHGRWVHRTLSGAPTACANVECACAAYAPPVPAISMDPYDWDDGFRTRDEWPEPNAPWIWPDKTTPVGVAVYSDHDGRSWACPVVEYQSGQTITVLVGDPPVVVVERIVVGRRLWWAPWLRRHTIEITETPLTEVTP